MPTAQDADEQWGMFSASSPAFEEILQMRPLTDFDSYGPDLLFGFMNDAFPSSA
jgi:hypothetical protein